MGNHYSQALLLDFVAYLSVQWHSKPLQAFRALSWPRSPSQKVICLTAMRTLLTQLLMVMRANFNYIQRPK
ncbi:hypothetical protein [Nostoc sp.]|uniref:hypothetical protein n=1 Tax=Nostoc sp. TaxID=1180 RepID=UPI002FF671DC